MSDGLITAAPAISRVKVRLTVQARPSQRSTRDWFRPAVKAQTSLTEMALAATTTSPLLPGNATWVQVEGLDPLRRQAVGPEVPLPWLKAQPPFRPAAMTTLKPLSGPLCTCLTIRQTGIAGWAVRGAARAEEEAAPVTASAAIARRLAVAAVARRTLPRPGSRLARCRFAATFRSVLSASCSSNSTASIQ